MSDKPVAMLVTAAIIAPICSICILGPVVVFSWAGGLFSGLDPVLTTVVAIVVATLAMALFKRRSSKPKALDSAAIDYLDKRSRDHPAIKTR